MPDDNTPMRPEPSKERLNAPSSRVIVKNTSEVQNHIVIDRFNVGHELRPGEAREMEMLNDEIANFQEQRRPDGSTQASIPPSPPDRSRRIRSLSRALDQYLCLVKATSDPFWKAHNLARSALPVSFCRSRPGTRSSSNSARPATSATCPLYPQHLP